MGGITMEWWNEMHWFGKGLAVIAGLNTMTLITLIVYFVSERRKDHE